MGVREMAFKVGDKVVVTNADWSHTKVGQEAVVTSVKDHGAMLQRGSCRKHSAIDENNWHWFIQNSDFEPAEPIGKRLSELDVKPGDVVKCVQIGKLDGWMYAKGEVLIDEDGAWVGVDPAFFHELSGLFVFVSRAAQPEETTAQRKMHPDDFVSAVTEFAQDNGFSIDTMAFKTQGGATVYYTNP